MSISRRLQVKYTLYDNPLRPATEPTVLWVQFERRKRYHLLQHRRRQHEGASVRHATPSIFPVLPPSYTKPYLSNPGEGEWTIRTDEHPLYLAPAIKIEIELMGLSLIHTNAGPCVPCYAATALHIHSGHVFAFRLFYGVTLHQATLRGLDAMLEKVPGSVSSFACAPQRYRYRGIDYEVVALRDGGVWLRPTDCHDSRAALHSTRAAPHRTPHVFRMRPANALVLQRSTQAANETAPSHPRRPWINRQTGAIPNLVRHRVTSYAWHPMPTTYRRRVAIIALDIDRRNQTRRHNDQLRSPSFNTWYRFIRDICSRYYRRLS